MDLHFEDMWTEDGKIILSHPAISASPGNWDPSAVLQWLQRCFWGGRVWWAGKQSWGHEVRGLRSSELEPLCDM